MGSENEYFAGGIIIDGVDVLVVGYGVNELGVIFPEIPDVDSGVRVESGHVVAVGGESHTQDGLQLLAGRVYLQMGVID